MVWFGRPGRYGGRHGTWRRTGFTATAVAVGVFCAAASAAAPAVGTTQAKRAATVPYGDVVPAPVSVAPASGVTYTLPSNVAIASDDANVGTYLASILRASTGYAVPLCNHAGAGISLKLSGAPSSVGSQGYLLTVTGSGITVRANQPAGLFEGVQTLLQLLPPQVLSPAKAAGPWTVGGGRITDYPRYEHRGAMLDVARHFFTVQQVEHYIDEIAHYKIDYFHLHLADDQGWRIAINGWPNLTTYGGSTEVGGGPGGYYTQADYQAIVAYAAARYITVVPEIDMPGHTNAALASYAELNCNGVAPPLYTGTDVGFSSLCVGKPITYQFLSDVIGQLAALTPGPYIHIGGDEAQSTTPADYSTFVNKVQAIVAGYGKTAIGWHDVVNATLLPSTVAQFWDTTTSNAAVAAAAQHGTKIVMSPANHAYLDMKYTSSTPLGQDWAGLTDVKKAYSWDPGNYLAGVPASAVIGVEGPLWTETIVTSANIDYMAFPRIAALGELGWSPESTHVWSAFRVRLAAQGPRWKAEGVDYYHSTQVPWPAGS